MYNLKEGANQQADKDSATVLLHPLLKCFTKLFQLGQASNVWIQPILIGLEVKWQIKSRVLAAAPTSKSIYHNENRGKNIVSELQRRSAKVEQYDYSNP